MKYKIFKLFVFTALYLNLNAQEFEKSKVYCNEDDFINVVPQNNLPLIDLINTKGEIIKTLKVPAWGCYGFVSFDKKYVFLFDNSLDGEKENAHRIQVSDNSIVTVPLDINNLIDLKEGLIGGLVPLIYTHVNNNEIFLYTNYTKDLSESQADNVNIPIDVYKVNFEKKEIVKQITVENANLNSQIGSSSFNKYFVHIDENLNVELFDLEYKKKIKDIHIDNLKEKVGLKKNPFIVAGIFNDQLVIRCSSEVWEKNEENLFKYEIIYDLVENKIISEEYLEGLCASMFSYPVDKTKFPKSISLIHKFYSKDEPQEITLNPFPENDFYNKPKKNEINQWIADYEIIKNYILNTINNNPDSLFDLEIIRPSVMSFMTKDQISYMESEYEALISLRDSLNYDNNEKRRRWLENHQYYTSFYSLGDCSSELFRIDGIVVQSATYIDDDIIEIVGKKGGRIMVLKYNTTLEKISESSFVDDF